MLGRAGLWGAGWRVGRGSRGAEGGVAAAAGVGRGGEVHNNTEVSDINSLCFSARARKDTKVNRKSAESYKGQEEKNECHRKWPNIGVKQKHQKLVL